MNNTQYQRNADHLERHQKLDEFYHQVQAIILSRQHPVSGLLPASTAITVHGNYNDAWVRDNVYSILSVWGLAIAYRRDDYCPGRAYELEQSVVKLMRGLLISMMKQKDKVEAFKHNPVPENALHAKYSLDTGDTVVGDREWGHLQLDATSLFLFYLAQMSASGLRIIFCQEEVDFVQNLVHYISKAYLIPDYGLWERGAKMNAGDVEVNASSVGMAKAALEAMRGFNLYGSEGGESSIVHVVEDDIANSRYTLANILPRESGSKEVDAALLSIIGFPAYSIEDQSLMDLTREKIVGKLQGRYGCKRFLLDGHQTVVEDHERLHYEKGELQAFENIESEWPLFFTYLLLDGLMREDSEQVSYYRKALEPLFIEIDGLRLLPELYYVAEENVEAERADPNSQIRLPNENVPLVWAQSLYLLSDLMLDGLLYPSDIDPLDRRWLHRGTRKSKVHVSILSADNEVQLHLDSLGISSQTPAQIKPVRLANAEELARAFCEVGSNTKLDITGRPLSRFDTLTTSRVYILRGDKVIFLPPFLDSRQSYFSLDNHFLVGQIKGELSYIQQNWHRPGRPLITIMVSAEMLAAEGNEVLVALLKEIQKGQCNGVDVFAARIAEQLPVVVNESVDFLRDLNVDEVGMVEPPLDNVTLGSAAGNHHRLSLSQVDAWARCEDQDLILKGLEKSANLYEQIELISILWGRMGPDEPTRLGSSLRVMTDALYYRSAQHRIWGIMRRAKALLAWHDESLEDELANIVLRRMHVAVGRSYSKSVLIDRPVSNSELLSLINKYGGEDARARLLMQEIILLCGKLLRIDPNSFKDIYTLQFWHLLLMLNADLAWERGIAQDEAFNELIELSPHSILERLQKILHSANESLNHLNSIEFFQVASGEAGLLKLQFSEDYSPELPDTYTDWLEWRKRQGAITKLTDEFCQQVWQDLGQCSGIVIGERLDANNRLDSEFIRADMTAGERNFARLIADRLNRIQSNEYRQLVVEALSVLSRIFRNNKDLKLDNYVIVDVLIGHAVRLHWLNYVKKDVSTPQNFKQHRADAWSEFYMSAPHQIANSIVDAFDYLSHDMKHGDE